MRRTKHQIQQQHRRVAFLNLFGDEQYYCAKQKNAKRNDSMFTILYEEKAVTNRSYRNYMIDSIYEEESKINPQIFRAFAIGLFDKKGKECSYKGYKRILSMRSPSEWEAVADHKTGDLIVANKFPLTFAPCMDKEYKCDVFQARIFAHQHWVNAGDWLMRIVLGTGCLVENGVTPEFAIGDLVLTNQALK